MLVHSSTSKAGVFLIIITITIIKAMGCSYLKTSQILLKEKGKRGKDVFQWSNIIGETCTHSRLHVDIPMDMVTRKITRWTIDSSS